MEHLVIRRGQFKNYDVWAWDRAGKLPTGLSALGASLLSGALVWAVSYETFHLWVTMCRGLHFLVRSWIRCGG